MGKFVFRLQRVLDYRTSLVEAQEAELSRRTISLRQALQELADIEREQLDVLHALGDGPAGQSEENRTPGSPLRVERVAATWRYMELLRYEQDRATDQAEERHAAVADARERLGQLKVEEQIMAKLRDRQQVRAEISQKRGEVKDLDDLTAARHILTHVEVSPK